MADQEAGEGENEESGGGKGNLIVLIGAVVVAIAAGVGGTLFFLGGDEAESTEVALTAKWSIVS